MEITKINEILDQLKSDPKNGRDYILSLSRTLIEWLGFEWVENDRPRLLDFKTLKLKEALAPAPITGQEQIYRLTAEGQELRVRFAVLKKYDKKTIQYIVDNHVGLISYQARMKGVKQVEGREPYISNNPYYLHFIATAKYDRLWVIFNEGEQKRVLVFRNRLSQTQYNKILPVWKNISAKPKPEMSRLLWSSLDVKEVNKDFYKQIKEQFDALIGIAQTQVADFDETMTKQFAVRLIGRYIFCWFLKEKEVIPETLISSKTIEKYKDFYFQELLSKLFFKTLNAEVTDPVRSENFTLLDELYKNIPYLNGGLFDWHSEDILFEKLDLNAWLISFVKVLENFDFTVDESSSQYQQVAIDPEMLGRIFENLLASQNPDTEKMANQRKAFGAFYTPREIVDYMVNESLRAYLETQLMPSLPEQINEVSEPAVAYKGTLFENVDTTSEPTTMSKAEIADIGRKRERIKLRLDKLFATDCTENPFEKDETIQVRKALSSITVLDPACGSGAFPMGVMLRLMELRQIVGHGYRNSYDLKEEILSRNIFGVDIMPMAVEIARLRAWLSLVLESDYKPVDRKNNFGIAALPNLDFKFICANSLIDSGYDAFLERIQYNATLFRLDGEIQKLENIRNQYFDPRGDKNRKTELQQEFNATKQLIKEQISVGTLIKNYNLSDFFEKVDDWNPFDDSHPSSFFSPAWMFGITVGFDVVIGNPPYVQIQKMNEEIKLLLEQQSFETYERTGDLYQLFYEQGIKILKNNGTISFITSNKWMRANYGVGTRTYFSKYSQPIAVVDFGMAQNFESATTYTNIFIGNKGHGTSKIPICRIQNDFKNLAELNVYVGQNTILIENPVENSWIAYSKQEYELIQKIEKQGVPINNWNIKINRGILTGCNEAFIINKTQRDAIIGKDEKSAELIRPILRGEDVKAFLPEFADLYLIATFPALNLNINEFEGIKKHLEKYREKTEPKPKNFKGQKWIGRKAGSYEWFETQDSISYYEDFSKPKIIYPNMTKYLPFVYDETGIVTNQKCFILSGEHLKYLTGVFNSTLWKFAFKNRFPELLGETYELSKVFFDKIPIKRPEKSFNEKISVLVDQIIQNKKQNLDTTALEKEIDVLVYKLYELTYDEVKIIDKDLWLSGEEYEQTKLS